jgi:hypothetical protein
MLGILKEAYDHAFQLNIQARARQSAGIGKTYEETVALQAKQLEERASIMPSFLDEFDKTNTEQEKESLEFGEMIQNDIPVAQRTSIISQFYQDRNEELALLTSSIQKSIMMLEEHELEQMTAERIIAESPTYMLLPTRSVFQS